MRHIRIAAATAAAAIVFAFTWSPAQARSCENGDAGCVTTTQQAAPMKLDHFMKTWKPVAASKRGKKPKSAKQPAAEEAEAESAVTQAPPAAGTLSEVASAPAKSAETDGVAVTSFNEVNEIDAAADQVQVVAFNEVNEVDLAAPVANFPAETTGQSLSAPPPAADHSWIGKLLLAAAGTIAAAGATRLLLA